MKKQYPFKDKQWLISMLNKHKTVKQLCIQEHLAVTSVNRYIRKYDLRDLVQEPQYHGSVHSELASDFFENINNEQKAYWLGMMMSDGNIGDNGRKSYYIRLSLKDYDHLYKFCDVLNISHDNVRVNTSGIGTVRVFSKALYNQLIQCGMHPGEKRLNAYPVNLRDILHRHFIRGYFDGDGSVFTRNQNDIKRKRSLCVMYMIFTNHNMAFTVSNMLSANNIDIPLCVRTLSSGLTVYELKTESIVKCKRFFNWIYDDSSIFMQRKYDKAIAALDLIVQSGRKARLIAG